MINSGRYTAKLDTGWTFQPDPQNQGEQEGWQTKGLPSPSAVIVPHTWNVQQGLEEYRGAGWYEQLLEAPEEWTGRRVRLFFEGAYRDTDIWVNGALAGSHYNSGYTPFEADITPYMLAGGNNRLVIRVDNRNSDTALPVSNSFDWADDGGLIRPVMLVVTGNAAVGQLRVEPKVSFNSDGKHTGSTVAAEMKLCEPLATSVHAAIRVYRKEAIVWQGTEEIAAGALTWSFAEIGLEQTDLWHFDHPHLYELEVVLTAGGEIQDRVVRSFGFREIVAEGHQLLLNREPVRLMGVEWMPGSHPDVGMAERLEDLTAMLVRLKEANCIITRFHWQQGNELLDWCDRNGLLVQEEIPHWQQPAEPGKGTLLLALSQAKEMIASHSHHPCIFAWGMGNELDGQSAVTNQYMEQLKQEFLQLDSTRLVNYVSNTLQLQPASDATGAGDMLMWNDYIGTWHGDLDEDEVIRQIIADHPDKPLVVAEYGLCEPAFEGGDTRRTSILREKTAIYRRYPAFAALIYFSLNDYRTQMGEEGEGRLRQRVHGSVDLYNRVKPSFAALREESSPLMVADEPVWKDGGLELTLECRNDIPSYTVRGYSLSVALAGGEVISQQLPDLEPGEVQTVRVELPDGVGRASETDEGSIRAAGLSILRPTGFSVLELQM
ncbi:glycoside hydrolase family 2 protein [Paenibacillus typhae]|uniref:Beta-glucuronidase n=1 Tax=Paenibacillus typhae TaxID=1174501 RepID=A0A1G9AXC1_9BACL|nr:sugar-binding domain-containing protein [Paenibacillus typhae]SDK31981.1 beta-glucuronidase [Paenibacillus typhae]